MVEEQAEEKRNINGCEECVESHTDEDYPERPCSCLCHYTYAELEDHIGFLYEKNREAQLTIIRLQAEPRPLAVLMGQNDKAAAAAAQDTDAAMVRLIAIQNRVLITVADRLLRSEVGAPR